MKPNTVECIDTILQYIEYNIGKCIFFFKYIIILYLLFKSVVLKSLLCTVFVT